MPSGAVVRRAALLFRNSELRVSVFRLRVRVFGLRVGLIWVWWGDPNP